MSEENIEQTNKLDKIDKIDKTGDDVNALSDNKVGVEIEPDVKSNNVHLQLCSCSIVLNCFTHSNGKSSNKSNKSE